LPASVLTPKRKDEAYRVVLGPYPTREQAEDTGRKLGMPSFIVATQDQPAQ
jgi:cell division protein FtsN